MSSERFSAQQQPRRMKKVAVVGPPGAGKTLVATSVAIYLHLASARAIYVDTSYDKRGARLVKSYVPVVDYPEAKTGTEYAVIDSAPYEVPMADKYVYVVEPHDKPPSVKDEDLVVVVNKASRLTPSKNVIPFDETIHWAMALGYPPIVVKDVRSWRRLKDVVRTIAESL